MLLAVKHDPELSELLDGACFSDAGVMPNIHPALITQKSKKKQRNENDSYVSAVSAAETSSENF